METEHRIVGVPIMIPAGSLIAEVVVVCNVIDPDTKQRLCVGMSEGLSLSTSIGMLLMVKDRLRAIGAHNWGRTDD